MSNPNQKIRSNIVPQDVTRDVQRRTLQIIAHALMQSFGPTGSYSAIVKYTDSNEFGINVTHTKDGHTIVKNMQFVNPIERSVQDLLTDLTHFIVKETGDGTTSAIILCSDLFSAFSEIEYSQSNNPSSYMEGFHRIINTIKDRIIEQGRELTVEDTYNICMISTNGNEEMSKTLYQIYKKYGTDVFIDVTLSPEKANIVKEYDGMTLETGFSNMCFVNDKSNNSARVPKPKIYCFDDPIDTPEMLGLVDKILSNNILEPLKPNSAKEMQPTVILCKRISPDTSSYMEHIIKLMTANPGSIPLLIVSDITQEYLFEDIAQMCGARFIKKYLNPDMQKKDQEAGLAPTIETICDFCGYADEVRSDSFKTQIIRPKNMFNEDGSYSEEYNTLIEYLKTQIRKAKAEAAGLKAISTARRRYNSLRGSMVDFLIGGITLSDREALKASVEDAVLNCRSASKFGVGYGANYMAFKTIKDMLKEPEYANNLYLKLLDRCYNELMCALYRATYPMEYKTIIEKSYENGCPLNIRTNQYDHTVLSSINSDVIILDTLDKLLTMMYITNQYLVPTPANNIYESWELE